MKRNIWLISIAVIIVLVIINNGVYYYITKNMLEDELKKELLSLAKQIELNVEQTRIGSEMFEEQIGRELRLASIAAKYALPNDIENVTEEQLIQLAKELDIEHLTLMKLIEDDDILLAMSTEKNQIGESTKNWYPWHQIFLELFSQDEVSEQWLGQSLPNFWSGPYEVSSTNYSKVYKWGYYYDGTTNYMIDPYVDYHRLAAYNQATGLDSLIEDLISSKDSLLEISIVNPNTFPNEQVTIDEDGHAREHIVQRPIVYGSYHYRAESDIADVRNTHAQQTSKTRIVQTEYVNAYKLFIPVEVQPGTLKIVDELGEPVNRYVLMITANYELLEAELAKSFKEIGVITFFMTVIMIPLVIIVMRYFRNAREQALQVAQDTYIEEINALFQSIRSQRHDFLNQVQTIHSLAKIKMYDELESYTEALAGDIHYVNDFINIGNPAVAALVRSKISRAEGHHIEFERDIIGVNLNTLAGKALDINRILGNLIDNAFDEVLKYEEEVRKIMLYGREEDGKLILKISNYCENAERIIASPLFKIGFSSKGGEHQGLGLSIVNELVKNYKGELKVSAVRENQIEFSVIIPL